MTPREMAAMHQREDAAHIMTVLACMACIFGAGFVAGWLVFS